MLNSLFNWIRKLGTTIHEWPCNHGYHEYGLYRPGTAMWWRECKHCSHAQLGINPKRSECDIDYYENVYLRKFDTLRKKPDLHSFSQ